LFAPIGAGAVLAFGFDATTLGVVTLPLIAGAFVYIAAADLVPQLHHHKGREMTVIVVALAVGLLIMYALSALEAILPGA
jgi:zinc transporter ZupT